MYRTPLDRLSLIVVIIGAINWLSLGLFKENLVADLFGGPLTYGSRIVYSLVGFAGLYSLSLLFREQVPVKD